MEDPPEGVYNYPALYYLAKSIDVIGKVDAVFFAKGWQLARGCKIEREIAKAYGVKILDYDFIEEPKEELLKTTIDKPMYMPCDYKTPISEPPYKVTCSNAVLGKHFKDGEFDMTTARNYGPIDPCDPLSRYYEDCEENHIPGL